MLNQEKHQLIMASMLRDIYTTVSIAPILGFKGGTCAYLFYGLPRFSVDLDFDLLSFDESARPKVLEEIVRIGSAYGEVLEKRIKRYTIFLLLSYGKEDRNIKIEINIRQHIPNIRGYYEMKEYLGVSILVARVAYLFTTKLLALTTRRTTAMRDVYDIRYFAKKLWDIDDEIIKAETGKGVKEYLSYCIGTVEKIAEGDILHGLGELLDAKQKDWARKHLKAEALFQLKLYQNVLP